MKPFIKWAGGKRQLLPYIHELMPKTFKAYREPFIGGGAVLFDLQPTNAIISDINPCLTNTYMHLKNVPNEVCDILAILDERIISGGKEYYYACRERFNNKIIAKELDAELAALLIFLNKHCFNGLYRENKKGLFNVPYNNSIKPSFDKPTLLEISQYLKNVDIYTCDFELICDKAEKDDFYFLDSPYAPLKDDTFDAYTKEGFAKEDHIRLSEAFKKMTDKCVKCMLTNHNTQFINDLYKDFNQQVVQVKRMINRNANDRKGEEVIITNY